MIWEEDILSMKIRANDIDVIDASITSISLALIFMLKGLTVNRFLSQKCILSFCNLSYQLHCMKCDLFSVV